MPSLMATSLRWRTHSARTNKSSIPPPLEKKTVDDGPDPAVKNPICASDNIIGCFLVMNRKCPITPLKLYGIPPSYHMPGTKGGVCLQSTSGHQQLTEILGQLPVTAYQSKHLGISLKFSW